MAFPRQAISKQGGEFTGAPHRRSAAILGFGAAKSRCGMRIIPASTGSDGIDGVGNPGGNVEIEN